MADTTFIKEYLVRLGFQPDNRSLSKFQGTLDLASRSVTDHVSGMAGTVVKATAGIVGGFTSISAAIVGVAENAAMASQSYRLMALHQLMSVQSAMKMDMVTKSLGATLAEIRWDPELGMRAALMAGQIDRMYAGLGRNYERNMLGIRNINYEFKRLEMGVKFLGMGFASSLFEKLFPTGSNTLNKLDVWMTKFQMAIPKIADELATDAVPILRTTWQMLLAIGDALKAGGVLFTNLVGIFSGDKTLQDTQFSFQNLSTAIQDVESWITKLIDKFRNGEAVLGHGAATIAALKQGHLEEAKKEADLALHGEPAKYGPKGEILDKGTEGIMKPTAKGGGVDWGTLAWSLGGGALGLAVAGKTISALTPNFIKAATRGLGRLAWRGISSPFRIGGIGSTSTSYEGFGGAARAAGAVETAGAEAAAAGTVARAASTAASAASTAGRAALLVDQYGAPLAAGAAETAGGAAGAAETAGGAAAAGGATGFISFLAPVAAGIAVGKILDVIGFKHVGGFILPPGLPTLVTKLHSLLHPSEKGERRAESAAATVAEKASGASDTLALMPAATFWSGLTSVLDSTRQRGDTPARGPAKGFSGGTTLDPITQRESKMPPDAATNLKALAGSDLPGRIAYAIAMVESGGNPNAPNFRRNNPGNLRSWHTGAFNEYPDLMTGILADREQINRNIARGLSLNEFFAGRGKPGDLDYYPGYSPAKDKNHPLDYAAGVAKYLGIDPSTPLIQVPSAAGGMEVPAGINSLLALLHPREVVLPAEMATGFKGMFDAGAPLFPAALAEFHARHQQPPDITNSHVAHQNVQFGGITVAVSITQPGATPFEIQRQVEIGVKEAMRNEVLYDLMQIAPSW